MTRPRCMDLARPLHAFQGHLSYHAESAGAMAKGTALLYTPSMLAQTPPGSLAYLGCSEPSHLIVR